MPHTVTGTQQFLSGGSVNCLLLPLLEGVASPSWGHPGKPHTLSGGAPPPPHLLLRLAATPRRLRLQQGTRAAQACEPQPGCGNTASATAWSASTAKASDRRVLAAGPGPAWPPPPARSFSTHPQFTAAASGGNAGGTGRRAGQCRGLHAKGERGAAGRGGEGVGWLDASPPPPPPPHPCNPQGGYAGGGRAQQRGGRGGVAQGLESVAAPRQTQRARPCFPCCVQVLVLGDSGVGKTCLLTRFTQDAFDKQMASTIGALVCGWGAVRGGGGGGGEGREDGLCGGGWICHGAEAMGGGGQPGARAGQSGEEGVGVVDGRCRTVAPLLSQVHMHEQVHMHPCTLAHLHHHSHTHTAFACTRARGAHYPPCSGPSAVSALHPN